MSDAIRVEFSEDPDWRLIGGGIRQYNTAAAGEDGYKHLCFLARTPDGEPAGGIIGATYWGWLYVDLLWLPEHLRGQGVGHELLTRAEELARERGAKHAYLDTFSFQARAFYHDHGYRVFGELPQFPDGHQRYFMTKEL